MIEITHLIKLDPALEKFLRHLSSGSGHNQQAQLDRIERTLMAIKDDINALIAAVDAATNAIAARIQKLIDQLAGGLSADEAQAVSAQLSAEVEKLQALGADPSNPVPPIT